MGLQSKKKSVLMGFTLLPYPLRAQGVSVRYLPIIEHLSKKYEIDFIIITGIEIEKKNVKYLQKYCRRISIIPDTKYMEHGLIRKLITYSKFLLPWNPPTTFISHYGQSVTQGIRNATKNQHYMAVIWVGWYLLPNFISALASISTEKVLVDFIDSPSLWAKRCKDKIFGVDIFERYEKWKIKKWESKIINEVDSTIYISEIDANTISSSLTPGKSRRVIPNGINMGVYTTKSNPDISSPNIGFLGNMSYGPNVEAVHWLYEQVFMPLRRTVQYLSLIIIGRDPVISIQELGKNPGVRVTGTVDDIWPYVNSVNIFVFPIWSGAGLKNKILEAMYARRPVVTTEIGNEGIDAVGGQELALCRTSEDFQREAMRLLGSPEERDRMGASAHLFVEEKFCWDKILQTYENLILGSIQESKPGRLRGENLSPRTEGCN
jgi:glycosyltransferase involved in cell wall biosynthesis